MNPYVLEKMLKEKHEDMLREAARQRLIAQFEQSQRKTSENRFLAAVGEKLIALGNRLQQRYGNPAGLAVHRRCTN